jgi:hypothetical protein
MKEDAGVAGVREDSSGAFNKLGGLDDVDEQSDGCSIMLGKTFVDVFGILDIKARCLDESLVFYFF